LKAAEAVHAHPTTRIISEDKHHGYLDMVHLDYANWY